jgi:molecular chaperone GrpE
MSKKTDKDWGKFKEESELLNEQFEEELSEQAEEQEGGISLDHPSYEELEQKLTLSEKTAHDNWEKSVRAMAELDNVRRRAEREVANAHRYGLEKMINSLLPVADSLEQALQLADKNADVAMHEGLELTMKLFLGVLEKHEVQQLDPIGAPFNPEEHEAMTIQASEGAAPNSVVAVFQKGYKLNDRVIRPARVVVAK